MRVLLTGASGFVGGNLAMALKTHGHEVRPVSRRDGFDMSRLLKPKDWLPLLEGIDAAVNAAGIIGETRSQRFDLLHTRAPVALFQACSQVGVRRVVQVSALGADQTAFSAYHLSKRAADAALLQLDVDGTVLRPSLIYGRGGTSATLFMRLAALPLIPVLQAGQQQLQPVHISDVVATILHALTGSALRHALDVVGPLSIAFADWMHTLRTAQGLPRGRLLHLPYSMAFTLFRLLQPLHPLVAPDNLRMLSQGYCADARAVEHFLGRSLLLPEPRLQFEDASILWRNP
jgi:uncharacterized protein YbjT (DUF2867 family)